MADFKLSASLEGHGDDVRGVYCPSSKTILSASRDATVRVWSKVSESPPNFDYTIASHGQAFVNVVHYIRPSSKYPGGLVIAGGKDAIIEVRELGKPSNAHAERLLIGHSNNICSLDVSADSTWIVSGSWDASARIWDVDKWECVAELDHEGSVWSVLAYDNDTVITASADKLIRIFNARGKLLQKLQGGSDVVRALCKLSEAHPSGAQFASAGNDGVVRLWELRGRQLAELQGHESFVYSIACLPNGDIVSSGEDRTVRIWRDNRCIQTITHPAISVWSVAVCTETGDIVSGSSDRIVRVFSRDQARQANEDALRAFEDSVKGSSIPQQQVGEINKEKLPGPEFLTQKSGTKEGQVQMIKEANGSVTAHTWSNVTQTWVNVGTVVDAVGSSGKKIDYLGKDYDYVFDVDIEDGKPPLKLPYNLSQNPYEAATKFIQDNELPIGYLDQVADFITTNTQGATIGQSSQSSSHPPPGADPWGTEARYRPGDANQIAAPSVPTERPKVLPQTEFLSIKTANLKTIQKKIEELNDQLLSSGEKDNVLNPGQISTLRDLTSEMEKTALKLPSTNSTARVSMDILMHLTRFWPPASRLPVLDLVRLLAAASPVTASYESTSEGSLIEIFEESGVLTDMSRPNNVMLAVRALANLFETDRGQQLADDKFTQVHALVKPLCKGTNNRNLTIAVVTLYINYSVLCTSGVNRDRPSSLDRAFALLEDLVAVLKEEKDSEIVYRSLVAAGTFMTLGDEAKTAAKDVFDISTVLKKVGSSSKEPRVKALVKEVEVLLA